MAGRSGGSLADLVAQKGEQKDAAGTAEAAASSALDRQLEEQERNPPRPQRRDPKRKHADPAELAATGTAKALRKLQDQEHERYRERRKQNQYSGVEEEMPPSRVLDVLTDDPDATEIICADGTPYQREPGYVYRWVRPMGMLGVPSENRVRSFQRYGYQQVKDPGTNEVMKSEFGILMRAKPEDSARWMLKKAPSGALRDQQRKIAREFMENAAEIVNQAAGTEAATVFEEKTKQWGHGKSREMVPGNTDYAVE